MKKRVISVILAVLIILSCSPVVFAGYDKDDFSNRLTEAWDNKTQSLNVEDLGLYLTEHPSAPYLTRPVLISEYLKIWSENPEYANVHSGVQSMSYGDSVVIILPMYYGYTNEELQAFDNAVNEIAEALEGRSDIDKIIGIYEYLVESAKYDFRPDSETIKKYSPYEAVLGERTVCQGYTRAFSAIADKLGIKSSYISSDSLNHAWNLVELNGKEYYLDITWDYLKHKNLLVGEDKLIENNHTNEENDWQVNKTYNPIGLYNNTEFENAFWTQAINRMSYVDGYWYYTDGIDIYKASTADITSSQKLTSHDAIDYFWNTSYGSDSGYVNYSDVEYCDGKLYFSTPYEIRSIDLDGDNEAVVYTLTTEEQKKGCIYDLEENNGTITYSLSYDINSILNIEKIAYKGSLVINCNNHKLSQWTVSVSSTCQTLGTEKRQCSKCRYCETRSLTAYGEHTYSRWETVTPATCISAGERRRACTVNGCDAVQTEVIRKTAHSYGEWKVACEPTCSQTGSKQRVCTNPDCLNVQTSVIECVSHSFGEWTVIIEPTCTQQGESERVCTACDYTEKAEVETTAHNTGADGKCVDCGKTTCDCGCHKTGIAKFFWKIVRFFWKVFANAEHKYCECGAVHY